MTNQEIAALGITLVPKKTKVMGHEVTYMVTGSSIDFNKLDSKRTDAANDEAVNNIVYRSMNPWTRYYFLHGRDEVKATDGTITTTAIVGFEDQIEKLASGIELTDDDKTKGQTFARKTSVVMKDGKPKLKDGVEVTRFDEAEDEYYKRALALAVKYKIFSSIESAQATFDSQMKSIATEVVFDVAASESAERGPKKLAAKYKITAAVILTKGTLAKVNENLLSKISESFEPKNDTSKMFTGKTLVKTNKLDAEGKPVFIEVEYNVSDSDAEALGWLYKRYQDWKNEQEALETQGLES